MDRPLDLPRGPIPTTRAAVAFEVFAVLLAIGILAIMIKASPL